MFRIDAAGAVDGSGRFAAPASILIEWSDLGRAGPDGGARILAFGRPGEVAGHPANAHAKVVARGRSVLIPGLVNAHTHLDLTHIGPRAHDPAEGFVSWVEMIRSGRREDDDGIAKSVLDGLRLSMAAGTVAVGDIAGAPRGRTSLVPWRTLRDHGARGVSFLEFFGIGRTAAARQAALREPCFQAVKEWRAGDPAISLQPHAPNTVSRGLYEHAAALQRTLREATRPAPLATHLAETPEEREFVMHGAGPQREMLERLGVWDDSILDDVGRGSHPVKHLESVLESVPALVAHVNDADDASIDILARTGTSVVYCPHASEYFGAANHFGPHRYREMLGAGVNVAVGTDSIVNLPAGSARMPERGVELDRASGISVLRELRLLWGRDRADALTLLRMGTINGARALGLDELAFGFSNGSALAGVLAVEVSQHRDWSCPADLAAGVLEAPGSPEVLFGGNRSGLAGIPSPSEA